MQFILGASYTMLHSFISYAIPVTVTRAAAKGHNSISASNIGRNSNTVTETHNTVQPCIITNGETYAIWMNVLYLAPLTYLFVSFFIASYLKRSSKLPAAKKSHESIDRRLSNNVNLAEKAGWDAARGVQREVYGNGARSDKADSDDSAVASADDAQVTKKASKSKGKGKSRRKA